MLNSFLRFTALSLLVFCFTNIAQAQVKIVPKFGYQLVGTDATIDDLRAEARGGWQAGADFRIGQGFIYVNPGFHFSKTTLDVRDNLNIDNPLNLTDEATVRSIKAPLLIGLRLPKENNLLNLRGRAGITGNYVTSVKDADNFAFDVNRLNRLTWAATAGVGVDLLMFTADLTFEKGLTDYYQDVEGANNTLTLSVGVKF